jgi:hypothetical protein
MTHQSLKPVGEWLGESFSQLRGRWVTLSTLVVFGFFTLLLGVVLVYGLGFVFFGFIQGWDNVMRILMDSRKLQYLLEESRGAFTLLNLLAAFVALRVYCWILLAAIHASMDASLGVRGSLKKGKGRGYAFLVLFLVQQVILQFGVVLLILPGIILAVWLGFALWAFAREGAGVLRSLGESARVVKGHFFNVLGRMLLVGLIGGAIMIVPLAGWLVGGAWIFLAWSLLYGDLRGPSALKVGSARRSPVAGTVPA